MLHRTRLLSLVRLRFLPRSGEIGSLALIPTLLCAPSPARSQEFEAGYVWAASHNAEFPTARGGEIQGLLSLGRNTWQVQLGLYRIWARTQRESVVCRYYTPPVSCQTEETRDRVRLAGFRAGIVRSVLAKSHAEVKLGAGLSLSSVTVLSSTGLVSHREGDVYPTSGANAGVFGLLTLDVTPVPRAGLGIRLGVLAHWVDFGSCSETYHRYDPFCSPATFREVQVGVSYSLPR
ncbi:MAG: hypothetical protein LJF06_06635 [Gemmatimonadetes bacterium]|nr:hypothetical protein [Gemmatimonadota bacterium]